MRLDIVREGRDPAVENSAGTIIRATCAKEYALNLQNPNGTVKCVRGRWKPILPDCTLRKMIDLLLFSILILHPHLRLIRRPSTLHGTLNGARQLPGHRRSRPSGGDAALGQHQIAVRVRGNTQRRHYRLPVRRRLQHPGIESAQVLARQLGRQQFARVFGRAVRTAHDQQRRVPGRLSWWTDDRARQLRDDSVREPGQQSTRADG